MALHTGEADPRSGDYYGPVVNHCALLAGGRTNREIAQTLVITVSTAERHVANILNKLGLRSRTEVALWAVAQSLEGSPKS
jgi:Bacterial regulatory proteins, luxR family